MGNSTVGLYGNLVSGTLAKGQLEQRNSSESPMIGTGAYIGQDGKTEIKQGASGEIGILSLGIEHSFDGRNGGYENENVKFDGGLGVGAAGVSISSEVNLSTGESSVSTGLTGGFKVAFIVGIELNAKFELTNKTG